MNKDARQRFLIHLNGDIYSAYSVELTNIMRQSLEGHVTAESSE